MKTTSILFDTKTGRFERISVIPGSTEYRTGVTTLGFVRIAVISYIKAGHDVRVNIL